MKFFVVLAVLVATAVAEAQTGYGAPSAPIGGGSIGSSIGSSNGGYDQQQQQQQQGPQTYKHVYIHTSPDEPEDRQTRTIRVPGGDKHVNIIFVKTPSSSSSQQTEVILPEQDEHKNLVYVLLKKGDNTADIKVRRPAARGPQKPEVYFIRYGNPQQAQQQGGYPQQQQQQSLAGPAPIPVQRQPSTQYGF